MIWWDFTNFEFLVFFVFLTTLVVLLICVVISIVVLSEMRKTYAKLIFNEKNTTRIFVIDIKSNTVIYFDVNNIKRKRKVDLASFYNLFHSYDVEKVKGWIFAICMNNDNVSSFIEADVLVGNKQSSYFSILKLLKYSREEGKIYIESNVLNYMTPANFVPKKSKIPYGIVDKEVLADLVNNAKATDGFLFGIRFVHLGKNIIYDSSAEKYMMYVAKNEIYPFVNGCKHPRQLLNLNTNEIYLLDLFFKSKEEALQLAKSLSKQINKAILTHGFENSISFSISIVANRLFYKDFDTLFDRAQMATIDVKDNDNKNIIYYERNFMFSAKVETAKFNNQINHLIENNDSVRCLYRPIIETSSGKIFAYSSFLKLYDSPFTSIFEAARYAAKINKSKQLIATTLKNIVTTYANEIPDKDIILFAPGSFIGIDNFKEVYASCKDVSNIKLVIVILESEISQIISEGKTITDVYNILSNPEISFAVSLESDNLILDSSIYSCFDYFILDGSLTRDIRRNNRNRLRVHSLLENLLKYKRPIIAIDLEGWISIELMIKAGINYLSSETISQSSDMLLPVDKKRLSKIAIMADKYK